jgi:hypothetical protein
MEFYQQREFISIMGRGDALAESQGTYLNQQMA